MVKTVEELRNIKGNVDIECQCSKCGKVFIVHRDANTGYNSSYYTRLIKKDEITCKECNKTFYRFNKEDHKKATIARKESFKKKLEKDSKVVFNSIEEMREAFKNKASAGKAICEECGKEIIFKDRGSLKRFLKGHDSFLCRGCSISKGKSSANLSDILSNPNKIQNCTFKDQEYIGAQLEVPVKDRIKYKFICNDCGEEFEAYFTIDNLHPVMCPKCNEIKTSTSIEEKELSNWVKSIYNGKVLENNRSLIYPYELDIYLPEINLAIEYDGLFWHCNYLKDDNYHLNKTNLCEERGVKLIHIFEDEWKYEKDEMKEIILSNIEKKVIIPEGILDRRFYSTLEVKGKILPPKFFYFTDDKRINEKSKYKIFDCGYILQE